VNAPPVGDAQRSWWASRVSGAGVRSLCDSSTHSAFSTATVPGYEAYRRENGKSSQRLPFLREITKRRKIHVQRIPPFREELKLSKAEPSIAWLAFLVDAPAFDACNPTPYDFLVLLCHEIIKAPPDSVGGRDQQVIGAIHDGAPICEPIQDKCRAEGLVRQVVKGDRGVTAD